MRHFPWLVILFVIVGCSFPNSKSTQTDSGERFLSYSQPKMKTDSSRFMTYLEGEVMNDSNEDLEFVRVIARLVDKNGEFLATEDGYLTVTQLAPRSRTSFKIAWPYDAKVANSSVTFVDKGGRPLRSDPILK